ncbi:MAG: TlpA family protein disulfide reductase [Actinomycetota bacterium]
MAKANPASAAPRRPWRLVLQIGVVLLALALLFEGYRSITSGQEVANFEFEAETMDGKRWSLAEHRGQRPVVLNFFATWCGPCKIEFPHLVALQEKYGPDGVQVVLVTDEPPELLKRYPEFTKGPLTYIPNAGDIKSSYGVDSIPNTFVFNREGRMVKQFVGYDESVPAEIEKLIK